MTSNFELFLKYSLKVCNLTSSKILMEEISLKKYFIPCIGLLDIVFRKIMEKPERNGIIIVKQ